MGAHRVSHEQSGHDSMCNFFDDLEKTEEEIKTTQRSDYKTDGKHQPDKMLAWYLSKATLGVRILVIPNVQDLDNRHKIFETLTT